MVRNEKSSVSSSQNDEHRRILTALLREEGNRRCADCNSRGPTWASVNLGVFVCLNCSGIHRSLGVHNSKVRSTNLDTWLPEQVAFVQAMGNIKGNAFWEARLPRDFHRPPEADMAALRVFITDKYVNRRYASTEYREPPSIENYMSHPFMTSVGSGGGSHAAAAENGSKTAAVAAPVAAAKSAVPVAPPPEFDLLCLDDPAPAAPAAAAPPPQAAAPPAAPAASWDPFAAIATSRDPAPSSSNVSTGAPTTTSISSSTVSASAAVPAPSIVDPFAEITLERPPSQMSMASSAAGGVGGSIAENMSASVPTMPAVVQDPFVLPPPAPAAAPPPPPRPPVAAPSSSAASSGFAPMRAPSGSVHSRGNLSHEDILAMFDKK